MKEIKLTQGKVALVDDEYYERVNQFKWCACKNGNVFYAARNVPVNEKWKTQKMHQFIMGDNTLKLDIDHIDHNGLNNQKHNLRFCTRSENLMNRRPHRNCSSIYKGVSWHKRGKKWQTHIQIDGKLICLGCFIIEEDAAKAYDAVAVKKFGKFSCLNFHN